MNKHKNLKFHLITSKVPVQPPHSTTSLFLCLFRNTLPFLPTCSITVIKSIVDGN